MTQNLYSKPELLWVPSRTLLEAQKDHVPRLTGVCPPGLTELYPFMGSYDSSLSRFSTDEQKVVFYCS